MRRRSSTPVHVVWGVSLLAVVVLAVALAVGCGSSGTSSNGGSSSSANPQASILRLAYSSTVTTWEEPL